ncbi:sulfatase-like hydrolase/transferase [Coraliomargarita sp. SDUM461004]|uniref:Sulfatase-like hydrolase/transferase n=1 Tax=Thalassobacterium sedimentorum TaxID=3041258 RepID=A0ABU1AJY2_9BACT|nr:sulfatase-like hydrolase/transferase [Coraliomargarita sp. SDUM461004]MDQ8194061.1 sulfatase-like hydrolase/transferase [Coraliomargarita sp. SDUM461004]
MNSPNILLLITDQQRWDSLGVYGAPEAQTPNLDKLASEGIRFDQCYCNNPICTPSRASLMTGGELPDHGVMQLEDVLDQRQMMFPELLRQAGYKTALFGKQHVSSRVIEHRERHPNDGFDTYQWCHEPAIHTGSAFNGYAKWLKEKNPNFLQELGEKGRRIGHFPNELHATRWTADATIDFLNEQSGGDTPFLCIASVFDPHDPYDDYPKEVAARIDQTKIRKPIPRSDDSTLPKGILLERRMGYMARHPQDEADIHDLRLGYHASISFIDEQFGRILKTLENADLKENTIVIFTSDHGDMLGDHGLMAKGAFFYDPCTRIPLLIRWPKQIKGNQHTNAFVQLNDLAGTIVEAAGISTPLRKQFLPHSKSLLPYLTGQNICPPRNTAICAYRHTGYGNSSKGSQYIPVSATMLREGDFKLCLYHDEANDDLSAEGQLFNMTADPYETNNLWNIQEYQATKRVMIQTILDWIDKREGGLTRFQSDRIPT